MRNWAKFPTIIKCCRCHGVASCDCHGCTTHPIMLKSKICFCCQNTGIQPIPLTEIFESGIIWDF